jgi:hypothetical protein
MGLVCGAGMGVILVDATNHSLTPQQRTDREAIERLIAETCIR